VSSNTRRQGPQGSIRPRRRLSPRRSTKSRRISSPTATHSPHTREDRLFTTVLQEVLDREEIRNGLKQISDLDTQELNRIAVLSSDDIWQPVNGERAHYATSYDALQKRIAWLRQPHIVLVNQLMRYPRVQGIYGLLGLGLLLFAYILSPAYTPPYICPPSSSPCYTPDVPPAIAGIRPGLWFSLACIALAMLVGIGLWSHRRIVRAMSFGIQLVLLVVSLGTAAIQFLDIYPKGHHYSMDGPLRLFLLLLGIALLVLASIRLDLSFGLRTPPVRLPTRMRLVLFCAATILILAPFAGGLSITLPFVERIDIPAVSFDPPMKPNLLLAVLGYMLLAGTSIVAVIGLFFTENPVRTVEVEARRASQDLRQALVEKGFLPFLRSTINDHLRSYSTQLTIDRKTPGLSELFDPEFEIRTSAADRLERLLHRMPGGSIGVSGPRGVGKTTLIRSFCDGQYSPDPRVTSAMVSVPVEYSARDFILHLFATLCRKMLGVGVDDHDLAPTLSTALAAKQGAIGLRAIAFYGLMFLAAGAGLSLLFVTKQEVDPGLAWAVTLVVIGLGLLAHAISRARMRIAPYRAPEESSTSSDRNDRISDLRDTAVRRLQEIKYLQTFSSAWSGAVKSPIGIEAGTSGTASLAQQQLSLPEIVLLLRTFLEQASRLGRVVIGIDELDKLASDDKAWQFLNDIKAIFGVEGCYYLISVSEEAMASFERRGMPFRDVFDSSFDEIIHVRYMVLSDARRLLNRRIVGLPIPFTSLCYCLSGGLPRDLIRAARNVVEPPHGETSSSLSTVTRVLVGEEVRGKTEAIVAALKGIEFEPTVSSVLRWCDELHTRDLSARQLLAHLAWFEREGGDLIKLAEEHESYRLERQTVRRLVRELIGFYYYCATILDFFNDNLTEDQIRTAAEPSGQDASLDYLARSRQAFAINARIAWDSVSAFRAKWGFAVLTFPEVLLTHG
jgi:hypothetical protein